ncbi:MAG: DUF3616 domain-containing protein [Cyanobacteria bacterium P01_D01_bin.123]
MTDAFLLGRALLQFHSKDEDLRRELSAVARTPDGHLWVGSDEYLTLERLTPLGDGIYGDHKKFHLKDYIVLADRDSEADIEGLDYADGYLWVVGSHSLRRRKIKGKKTQKDIERLTKIKRDPNRYLLARVPVLNGELVESCPRSDSDDRTLSAARLGQIGDPHPLMEALSRDEHLGPFLQMGLPSKDNGFDIEGLAVRGNRVFIGLRGPVLRGWALLLELRVETSAPGTLSLAAPDDGVLYRKHFLDLNGLGIRELCLHGKDLIILAGPTMTLTGAMQIFLLENAIEHERDTLSDLASGKLKVLFDLPFTMGSDNAEGLTLFPCLGYDTSLMVVYDSPSEVRLAGKKSVCADIFRLPGKS